MMLTNLIPFFGIVLYHDLHRALDQTLVPAVPKVVAVHHQFIHENHVQEVKVNHSTQINRIVEVIAVVDQKVVVVHHHTIQPIQNPKVGHHLRFTQSPEVVQYRCTPLIQNHNIHRHNIQPIQSLAVDRHLSIRILVQM